MLIYMYNRYIITDIFIFSTFHHLWGRIYCIPQNVYILQGTKINILHILSHLEFFKDTYSSYYRQC